jgi:hypothetical protein
VAHNNIYYKGRYFMADRLYILDTQFDDPAFPGQSFYCRDCITVDGLLSAFPKAAATLEIVRIAYPRPRQDVIALLGEANQNLPVLVLDNDAPADLADGEHEGTYFVGDLKALLHALHIRHGFPEAHS